MTKRSTQGTGFKLPGSSWMQVLCRLMEVSGQQGPETLNLSPAVAVQSSAMTKPQR